MGYYMYSNKINFNFLHHGTPQQLRIGLALIAIFCVSFQLHSILNFHCPNCHAVDKGPTRLMMTEVSATASILSMTKKTQRSSIQDIDPFDTVQVEDDANIRKWGCTPRNETPFIFVHIGKAGGGMVRSRMAAAAFDYNRSAWYRLHEKDEHYYPIYDQHGNMHKGTFGFSQYPSWVPESLEQFHGDLDYEGYGFCSATTPLGIAVACPNEQNSIFCQDRDNDTMSHGRCDIVYMGHNLLGSELHWLPTSYIVKWWNKSPWGRQPDNAFVAQTIQDRDMNISQQWHVHEKVREIVGADNIPNVWCSKGPYHYRDLKFNYHKCYKPKEAVVDKVYKHIMGDDPLQAARLTANIPVMRVTVLREPFSWLISKFFWHPKHYSRNTTVVLPDAGFFMNRQRIREYQKEKKEVPPFIKCDDVDEAAYGWVSIRATMYLFYLCGEHCMGAWGAGTLSLEDLERQAAYNLRHSFAVVGLLHKTDEFYQMVKARVSYMDTALNPNVTGKLHPSSTDDEALRCKEIYKNVTFQQELLSKSPALQALSRIYDIAVEVNEFQKKEMFECGYEILPNSSITE